MQRSRSASTAVSAPSDRCSAGASPTSSPTTARTSYAAWCCWAGTRRSASWSIRCHSSYRPDGCSAPRSVSVTSLSQPRRSATSTTRCPSSGRSTTRSPSTAPPSFGSTDWLTPTNKLERCRGWNRSPAATALWNCTISRSAHRPATHCSNRCHCDCSRVSRW